jgi:RNA polymerase sigma factor (sigma-70 family)
MFDAPYEDPLPPVDDRVMSDGDRHYQDQILEQSPDEALLTKEQEQELAQTVQLGLAAAKKLLHMEPSDSEYNQLLAEAAEGQAARDELVITKLRLAAWLVRETMDLSKQQSMKGRRPRIRGKIVRDLGSLSGGNLGYDDRMQIATLALIKAAERYDGSKGGFAEFALWEMESDLVTEIGRVESPMRLPLNQSDALNRVKRSREALILHGNLDPDYEDLAQLSNIAPSRLQELDDLQVVSQHISFEELAEKLAKLREGAGDESEPPENLSLADVLVSEEVDEYSEVSNIAALYELGQRIDWLLSKLTEREQEIIILRFGLEGGEPMTLGEIGEIFGVTRERIRTIEKAVLNRLRGKTFTEVLLPYSEDGLQDPQHGLRPELRLTADEDEALGVSKPRLRAHEVYAWEKSPGYTAGRVRTYTLEEYRQMKGE